MNQYAADIPLKRAQETFVDAPRLLDDVALAELEFDLAHGVKDINGLHVFHAIAVLEQMLEDLIMLGENPAKLAEFRALQLQEYGFGDESREIVDSKEIVDSTAPEVKKAPRFHDDDLPRADIDGADGNSGNSGIPPETSPEAADGAFVPIERLVATTSLEKVLNPITTHSLLRLRRELAFHRAPSTQTQAAHLVRAFTLAKPPPISIREFLLRINKYSPSVSVSVYVHSAYLLFKLSVLLGVVTFTNLNVYRFILALIRLLTKKCEDVYQKQKSFAMVGGMALKDLGRIEVSFLYLCNFKLVVSEFILNDFLTRNFVLLRRFCRGLEATKP